MLIAFAVFWYVLILLVLYIGYKNIFKGRKVYVKQSKSYRKTGKRPRR